MNSTPMILFKILTSVADSDSYNRKCNHLQCVMYSKNRNDWTTQSHRIQKMFFTVLVCHVLHVSSKVTSIQFPNLTLNLNVFKREHTSKPIVAKNSQSTDLYFDGPNNLALAVSRYKLHAIHDLTPARTL